MYMYSTSKFRFTKTKQKQKQENRYGLHIWSQRSANTEANVSGPMMHLLSLKMLQNSFKNTKMHLKSKNKWWQKLWKEQSLDRLRTIPERPRSTAQNDKVCPRPRDPENHHHMSGLRVPITWKLPNIFANTREIRWFRTNSRITAPTRDIRGGIWHSGSSSEEFFILTYDHHPAQTTDSLSGASLGS